MDNLDLKNYTFFSGKSVGEFFRWLKAIKSIYHHCNHLTFAYGLVSTLMTFTSSPTCYPFSYLTAYPRFYPLARSLLNIRCTYYAPTFSGRFLHGRGLVAVPHFSLAILNCIGENPKGLRN